MVGLLAACAPAGPVEETAEDEGNSEAGSSEAGGSESGTAGEDVPQVAACEAPAPCDTFDTNGTVLFDEDYVDPALTCAVDRARASIEDGVVARVHNAGCDIGCVGEDVLLLGDGTALYQRWTSQAESNYGPPQLCTLQAPEFFTACEGAPAVTGGCYAWSAWFTSCEPVDELACP